MIQEITYVALAKVLVVSLGLATCSVACLAKDEPALRVGVSSFAANYDESSPIVEQTVETLRKALFHALCPSQIIHHKICHWLFKSSK